MYLCLMYICPDVSKSGGGDVPMSDVSKSAPSKICVARNGMKVYYMKMPA